MTKRLFVLLIVCFPALAFAHPGHGDTDPASWRHYLTEPEHVALLAVALVGIGILVHGWAARRKARKLLSPDSCER